MSQLVKRIFTYKPVLPAGARYYKTKNNRFIYTNLYKEEFYIVYRNNGGYIVETYRGKCNC